MNKLQVLLEDAYRGKSALDRAYGSFPVDIAEKCGPDEISEVIGRLDRLCEEKRSIEEWDGDGSDDIWRSQKGYSQLLEKLTSKYPTQIATGLKSPEEGTRFWIAHAFMQAPSEKVIPELEEYYSEATLKHHKDVGHAALTACKKKLKFFQRWFK